MDEDILIYIYIYGVTRKLLMANVTYLQNDGRHVRHSIS
jgi:hypothetical protein